MLNDKFTESDKSMSRLGKRGGYGCRFFEDIVFDTDIYSLACNNILEVVFMGVVCAFCCALWLNGVWG